VIRTAVMSSDLKKYGQQIMKLLPVFVKDPSKLPRHVLDQEREKQALQEAASQLSSVFSCNISVVTSCDISHPKVKQAAPGKPALLVE